MKFKLITLFAFLFSSSVILAVNNTFENINPKELKVHMSKISDNYNSVEFFLNNSKIISDNHLREIQGEKYKRNAQSIVNDLVNLARGAIEISELEKSQVNIIKGKDGFYTVKAVNPEVQKKIDMLMKWDYVPGSKIESIKNRFVHSSSCELSSSGKEINITVMSKFYATESHESVGACQKKSYQLKEKLKAENFYKLIKVSIGSDNKVEIEETKYQHFTKK